ncbi:hypothetical protein BDA96_01G505500 [Sorghum bicolor]|uniref:Uncharacterized protein n=1 Tax=Sorghum bicolor TaxID=4558 RepID=A0A921V1C5_SORBI|nr:hypothetical protein BDA96_01G505500 [Sorghum bicolor]
MHASSNRIQGSEGGCGRPTAAASSRPGRGRWEGKFEPLRRSPLSIWRCHAMPKPPDVCRAYKARVVHPHMGCVDGRLELIRQRGRISAKEFECATFTSWMADATNCPLTYSIAHTTT